MSALLLAVHGSRAATANRAMEALADRVAQASDGDWGSVAVGFLQFGSPSLRDALDGLARSGARKITIVPLFLTAGHHVQKDIPSILSVFSEDHPETVVQLSPHLGAWHALPEAVLSLASDPSDLRK